MAWINIYIPLCAYDVRMHCRSNALQPTLPDCSIYSWLLPWLPLEQALSTICVPCEPCAPRISKAICRWSCLASSQDFCRSCLAVCMGATLTEDATRLLWLITKNINAMLLAVIFFVYAFAMYNTTSVRSLTIWASRRHPQQSQSGHDTTVFRFSSTKCNKVSLLI